MFKTSVSVIIPAYNSELTIERALNSVFKQTCQPQEIIVVDDGSTDRTVSIVEDASRRYKTPTVKVVQLQHNHGPAYARNAGWQTATGNFLAFLDADDSWHQRKLEIQIGYMSKHENIAITGHDCLCLKQAPDTLDLPEKWDVVPTRPRHLLMVGSFLLTPSVVIRSDVRHRFMPEKRFGQDRLLWSQMILDGYKGAKLRIPLAYTYKQPYGQAGQSKNLWNLEKGELEIYTILRQNKQIGRINEYFLKMYSLLKYVYRTLKCWRRHFDS